MTAKSVNWSREPASETERMVRETFLAREMSHGLDGLITIVLLARRQRPRNGRLPIDLEAADTYAAATIAAAVGDRESSGLAWAAGYVAEHGAPFAAPPAAVPAPDDDALAAQTDRFGPLGQHRADGELDLVSSVHMRRAIASKIERFLQTG